MVKDDTIASTPYGRSWLVSKGLGWLERPYTAFVVESTAADHTHRQTARRYNDFWQLHGFLEPLCSPHHPLPVRARGG